jgi:hypothetical protein
MWQLPPLCSPVYQKKRIASVADNRYMALRFVAWRGGYAMKWKDEIYRPEYPVLPNMPLRTMGLFERDASGHLVYAPTRQPIPRQPNPRGEDRRASRRLEWRHDGMIWTVNGQGRVLIGATRTCNVSVGGCCILLDRDVEPGTLLDLDLPEAGDTHGYLPLAEVLAGSRKGDVWLVRCAWLQNLRKIAACWLVGTGETKQQLWPAPASKSEQSWLMQLWKRFRSACATISRV